MAASKVKFTSPDLFKGDHKLLCTWLFHMNEYTELCGITISTEKVKMAVLGLDGAALTWWESVQMPECKDFRNHSHSHNDNSNNEMQVKLNILHAVNLGI